MIRIMALFVGLAATPLRLAGMAVAYLHLSGLASRHRRRLILSAIRRRAFLARRAHLPGPEEAIREAIWEARRNLAAILAIAQETGDVSNRMREARREARRILAATKGRYPHAAGLYAMTTKMHTDITTGAPATAAVLDAPLGQLDNALADIELLLGDYVVTGGLAGTSATLIVAQPATRAFIQNAWVNVLAQNLTMIASNDNYVDLDNAGVYHVTSVANGAGAPVLFASSVRLYKAVTSAGAVTSVTDLRNINPLPIMQVFRVSKYGVKDGGDATTAATSAYNDAIAAGAGIVWWDAGNYNTTASLPTISKPGISVLGPGSQACFIKPTAGVTGDVMRIQMNPFSAWTAGKFGGFSIDGTLAGANAVGFHYGDTTMGAIDDLHVLGFTGAAQIGLLMDNNTTFTERTNMSRVHIDNCKTGIQWQVSGAGQASFAYTRMLHLVLNVNAGQTGFLMLNNGQLFHGMAHITGNIADTGIFMRISGTAQLNASHIILQAEQTSGAGGTGIQVDAGAKLFGAGFLAMGTLAMVNNNAASTNAPNFRVYSPVGVVDGTANVMDTGTIANFGGSGNAGRILPLVASNMTTFLATLGAIFGTNIDSPYASFFDAAGNGFYIFKLGGGIAPNAMVEMFRFGADGKVLFSGDTVADLYRGGAGVLQTDALFIAPTLRSSGEIQSAVSAIYDALGAAGTHTWKNNASAFVQAILDQNGALTPNALAHSTAVTLAAAIAPDLKVAQVYDPPALTANQTVAAPLNPKIGAELIFVWTQDGTGGRVITYNAGAFRTTGAVAFATTLSTITIDRFVYDGAVHRIVSRITGQTI